MKIIKKSMTRIIPAVLVIALLFSCVISAGAASYRLGDADLDGKVDIVDATQIQRHVANMIELSEAAQKAADVDQSTKVEIIDATLIQRFLNNMKAPEGIDKIVRDHVETYSLNAELMEGTPGVYEVKAAKGDKLDGDNAKTIGIPEIAKQTLSDYPTEDIPAIIMGAATPFEKKTGAVEYTMNDGLTEEDITAPYSYFRHKIIDETVTDADGNVTTHKKLSGFDGTYYIVRVDVSDIIDGKTGYLHVKQESNKALMVQVGMLGGICTGEVGLNADGTYTETPHIDEATNHWFVGTKDTGIVVDKENASLCYVDADGLWCVAGKGFSDGLGNATRVYSLENNAEALKDKDGNYTMKPYVDVILMSSAKTVAGADAGTSTAPSADVKLSMYVDETWDYNPELKYDPTSQDVNHATNVMNKFYNAEAFTEENNATSYLVKGSDLEIDVMTANPRNGRDVQEFWSLTKAFAFPEYDSHTIKLICEVPVLEGLSIEGTADNRRNVILDVNSFDIQVANHAATDSAGLTVKGYATLTITDDSNTSGAELAIGNNASMEIEDMGTLIIDDSCQLEVEYDAATVTPGQDGQQPSGDTTPLNNGVITVHSGGRIINNGVINIEGLEVKPVQPNQQEQEQQQTVVTDMKSSCILIEEDGILDNYGCLSLKGNLYVMGALNNFGRYEDVIAAQDPDKGVINYHKGIQLTWKDDVTVLDEATGTYSVNPDVTPGALFIGADAEGNKNTAAELNNYGDIVLVPGTLNISGEFKNFGGGEVTLVGKLYICAVTEAVVPIQPDPNDPTKTEERRQLSEPYPSVINKDETAVITNNGFVAEASVQVLSNGVLGDLTVIEEIEI